MFRLHQYDETRLPDGMMVPSSFPKPSSHKNCCCETRKVWSPLKGRTKRTQACVVVSTFIYIANNVIPGLNEQDALNETITNNVRGEIFAMANDDQNPACMLAVRHVRIDREIEVVVSIVQVRAHWFMPHRFGIRRTQPTKSTQLQHYHGKSHRKAWISSS